MDVNRAELETSREAHLRDYWKILWQGRYTLLAIFLLVVTGTAVYTYMEMPVYRATAIVVVQPKATSLGGLSQDVAGMGAMGYSWFTEEKYHNTQLEVMQSRAVAERAFDALRLWQHPMFEGVERADAINAFRGRVQVASRRKTGLVEISIEGGNPYEITEWVNAVAGAYVDRNLEEAQENVDLAVTLIGKQIEPLRQELSASEERAFQILEETEIFDPVKQEEILRQRLDKYSGELTTTQIELRRLENRLNKIDELQQSGADPMTLPELAEDDVLQSLTQQKLTLEREIESVKVTLRKGHPVYEKKINELGKIDGGIRDRVNVILANLESQLFLTRQNEVSLRDEIRLAEEQAFRMGKATSQYDLVKTEAETRRELYDLIKKTMREVQLTQGLLSNNIKILDRATIPKFPVKPRRRVNLVLGALFGLLLATGAVFFLDYLDNTFRTPQDIEDYLRLSVLAVIPKIQNHKQPSVAIKEAFQSLRSSVIFSSKNRRRKTALITSSGPQEGKSSTVANLARTLASAGDRVIVVDCDLRKPTQHHHLKVSRDFGLTNYLAAPAEETGWHSYVKQTEVDNLHVIPCGPIPPSPPELLGSDRFKRLLSELKEQYDWVLIDSPPAASLADAPLLATAADMVVLVIRHNQTDRDLVIRSVQHMHALNVTLVGAVLNNVDLERAYHKDYYYAGYYYYSAGGEGERRKSRSESEVRAGVG